MPTKRMRPSGTWEYVVRRKGVLPKPLSLTFNTEEEGDAYVARLEQMLDAGILPERLVVSREDFVLVDEAIRGFLKANSVPSSDVELLGTLMNRLKDVPLQKVSYQWAEGWVREMKRHDNIAPVTIRHYVGALARCLDWVVRSNSPVLAVNPLRLLPKRYATYTEDDSRALIVQKRSAKRDEHRDRRLSADEEARVRSILAKAKPGGKQRPLALFQRPALILLFELAVESAMRLREMYTLSVNQVDVGRRTIFLEKTKNGHKRQVPMTSVALRAYEDYVALVRGRDSEMEGVDLHGNLTHELHRILTHPWTPVWGIF